ncbi:MAG: MATE family efflux transporter [bacterium]
MIPEVADHPFRTRPHRTLIGLALPVLVSLIAEPLTGLVDTAFVSRLGTVPLAALGVGTVLLSSLFWVFNFLGIGTQSSVAKALGSGHTAEARTVAATSIVTAIVLGVVVASLAFPFLGQLVGFMGASDEMREGALAYLRIRLLGAPAILLLLASFGALRGRQDMRTPLYIAVGLNILNVALDALLIFGWGPVPAFGLAGAASASVFSQWAGALVAIAAATNGLGGRGRVAITALRELFVVGRDLVVRTGSLLLFLLLATREATLVGTDAAAAHQAVRQVWMFGAFLLDAWAASAQSLVGFFLGAAQRDVARRVAGVATGWALLSGVAMAVAMFAGQGAVVWMVVPPEAEDAFAAIWWISAIAQPLNALSFVTDGIHWGTGDYRYLRNVMLMATVFGATALLTLPPGWVGVLPLIWWITMAWIGVRAAFGLLRIWPGIGAAPLLVETAK